MERKPRRIEWSAVAAEKDGHKHFMHKEIFEQPRAVADTVRGRASLEQGDVILDGVALDEGYARGAGAGHHRGLRHLLARRPGRPAHDRAAGPHPGARWSSPASSATATCWSDSKVMTLAISQSGETADTLAAVKVAKARGSRAFAICNVVGSAIPRECDGGTLFTHAGPEIGVASTKAFTTQLAGALPAGGQAGPAARHA